MGLIKAALSSVSTVLADQWKEYFYCDSLSENVLAAKGQKKVSGRSSNTKGSENVITNGSVRTVETEESAALIRPIILSPLC